MGRRARTNCSPVDSAMEKYHNDIGNRLSGVFLPTHPCAANNESDSNASCDAFSMLTLDFRGHHNVKQTKLQHNIISSATIPQIHEDDIHDNKSTFEESIHESHRDDSAFDSHTPKRTDTLSSFNSQSENSSSIKEKRNIVDKLARAIFQRKHTCARCQRRSKSCLQNKTFNVSEKHYTCARCRETSRAIKNMVSGQDAHTDSDSTGIVTDLVVPKPRVQLKDSGYETVTSCSTVASAHSHSTSPYASSNKQTTDKSTPEAPCSRVAATDEESLRLIRQDNTDTPYYIGSTKNTIHCSENPSAQSSHPNPNTDTHSGLEQFLGVVGSDGVRVLKQVKTRYVQNYDGYLPGQDIAAHPCDVIVQSDPTHNGHHHQHKHIDSNINNNNTQHSKSDGKACHICLTSSRPCFRLPWEGGWLCEECIDGML